MTPLRDAAGVEHAPAGDGARIVSLVPSITELLFDLDLAPVGRTAFCVHPKDRVREARSIGGTKTVNMDKLAALDATHVVVNIDETPRELADTLAAQSLEVIVTHPVQVADNLGLYRLMGGLFGREAAAEALCARFQAAYDSVTARDWPDRKAAYLIWKDPWMTVSRDTYISRMLALAGIDTLCWVGGDRYPRLDWTDDLIAGLDLILLATEPFPFTADHLAAFIAAHPAAEGKARLVDGEMISWYGSRAVAGLGYLEREFT
ncbi:MAG: ABC transporter substrate-binding protein [Rhodobacterales bacterium]|nr:ABC transporter substrate-binding protein [Rhodobacterales bacterium]